MKGIDMSYYYEGYDEFSVEELWWMIMINLLNPMHWICDNAWIYTFFAPQPL
jgi:hypothetical protein